MVNSRDECLRRPNLTGSSSVRHVDLTGRSEFSSAFVTTFGLSLSLVSILTSYKNALLFILSARTPTAHWWSSTTSSVSSRKSISAMTNNLALLVIVVSLWVSPLCGVCGNYSGFRICFKTTEHSSQCQGPSHTCSGWSSNPKWTQPFRDDTDGRPGGCGYQWRIERHPHNVDPRKEYRLCFAELEGSSQCQGTRTSCTGWSRSVPSWTRLFRDDTDDRAGGCRYVWKIESRDSNPAVDFTPACRVCFKETEGSSQCQQSRHSCSGWTSADDPAWTLPFRDDTDGRPGGCGYQWFLDCTSAKPTPSCSVDKAGK